MINLGKTKRWGGDGATLRPVWVEHYPKDQITVGRGIAAGFALVFVIGMAASWLVVLPMLGLLWYMGMLN